MANLQDVYAHLKQLAKQWFYDKDEVDEKLDEKVDNDRIFKNGVFDTTNTKSNGTVAHLWNESDGGGVQIIDGTSNVKAFTGVNEGSDGSDIYVQSYAIDKDSKTGTRITLNPSGAYYTTGKSNYTFTSDDEIVTRGTVESAISTIIAEKADVIHEHSAADIKDSSAYTNIGTSANASQHAINFAVDSKIGSLLNIELVELVDELPAASADTLNRFYLVAEDTSEDADKYKIYITVKTQDDVGEGEEQTYSYAWEKVDTARIDLSNKADIDHIHGNITNSGSIGNDSGKVITTSTDGVLVASDWLNEIDNILANLIEFGDE